MSAMQRDETWLKTASPGQITAALAAGELVELLTGGNPPDIPEQGQLNDVHLAAMTPAQIAEAFSAGRTDGLLVRPVAPPPPVVAEPAAEPAGADPDFSTLPLPDPAVYAALAAAARAAGTP